MLPLKLSTSARRGSSPPSASRGRHLAVEGGRACERSLPRTLARDGVAERLLWCARLWSTTLQEVLGRIIIAKTAAAHKVITHPQELRGDRGPLVASHQVSEILVRETCPRDLSERPVRDVLMFSQTGPATSFREVSEKCPRSATPWGGSSQSSFEGGVGAQAPSRCEKGQVPAQV